MVIKILSHLEEITFSCAMIRDMKKYISDNFSLRYTSEEQKNMIDITFELDFRFKIRVNNSSSSQMHHVLCEAIVVAKHQPDIIENDSET